jgi:hypothetical protein
MFDPAIAEQITERLSSGEPLEQICRELPQAPTSRTIRRWIEENPTFSSAIARARELGFDAIAADCLKIADDARNDWMERHGEEDAGWVANGDHIQRSRLRVDTRLKLLAKWDPKRYGDKLQVDADLRLQVELIDATQAPVQATAQLATAAALAHKTKEDPL